MLAAKLLARLLAASIFLATGILDSVGDELLLIADNNFFSLFPSALIMGTNKFICSKMS